MTGEQHERAVRTIDPRGRKYGLSAFALGQIIDAYHTALREQGVRLIDLREVVGWMEGLADDKDHGMVYLDPGWWANAIERRFGGNERSDK